jgi:hypothetical protein
MPGIKFNRHETKPRAFLAPKDLWEKLKFGVKKKENKGKILLVI